MMPAVLPARHLTFVVGEFFTRASVFQFLRVLSYGFLENVYEKALMIELSSSGLSAESQVPPKVIRLNQFTPANLEKNQIFLQE